MSLHQLNHPVLFVFFIFLGVTAYRVIFKWIFTKLGWTGPASIV